MKQFGVITLLFAILFLGGSNASLAQNDTATSSVMSEGDGNRPVAIPETQINSSAAIAIEGGQTLFFPYITHPPIATGFALDVFHIVNAERANAGCGPLSLNRQLTQAALGHSRDMGLNDFFSHTGSNGSSPWARINASGYQFSSAGENIAAGYSTPEAVMVGWMNSSGHRANILNCGFQEIGVGYFYLNPDNGNVNYRHYWTQVFASPG